MVRRMKPSLVCRVGTSHSAIAAYWSINPAMFASDLGRASFGRFLEKPAEFDLRLELAFDRGPEADLLPGKRINPGVHRDPV